MILAMWNSETFPVLSDIEHDLLCAAQDAGGDLSLHDLLFSADIAYSSRPAALNGIRRLVDESLLASSAIETYCITSLGDQYLSAAPPEGVEI